MSQAVIQPLDFRALFGLAQQVDPMDDQDIKDFFVRISPHDLPHLSRNFGRIYQILRHVCILQTEGELRCMECDIEIECGMLCEDCAHLLGEN